MIEGVLTMLEENFQTALDIAYRIVSQKNLRWRIFSRDEIIKKKNGEVTGVSVIPVN